MVVNALANHLIRTGRVLGALDYNEELGVDMYKIGEKQVSVFYSGILSGAHAIDNTAPCSRLTGMPYSIGQRAISAENEKRLPSEMECETYPSSKTKTGFE